MIERITRLHFKDELLADIELPSGILRISRGLGSGLAVRPGSEMGQIWAVGDRGPNLKAKTAAERYGAPVGEAPDKAKVMPCPDIGPALAELRVSTQDVRVVRVLTIRDQGGQSISGLPTPAGSHAEDEPVVDIVGRPLGTDPSGADTEGLIALADGGFWVADEYGPSLLRLDAEGRIVTRWIPVGLERKFAGAHYPVEACLPALAARRHINRGFEAIAMSPDEQRLYLAFQSPLDHPDQKAHEAAAHARFWTLDAATGAVIAQHLYPLDPPSVFRRDRAAGPFERADIKLSELAATGDGRLICLERGSATTKLYVVSPETTPGLPPEQLAIETRPTVEEVSATGELDGKLSVLRKSILLDTDDHLEIGPDLEGIALLASDELLLVSDNDFGVEGAKTGFWRVKFSQPI